MFTVTAKVLNYISSYLLLYPLLMIRIIFAGSGNVNLWEGTIKPNLPLLIVLAGLLALSIVWLLSLLRWKNNTRIKGQIKENITFEMAMFLVTYIVPLMFINISMITLIIYIVVFIILGIAFVVSDKHFLNPTFLLLRYKLYRLGDSYVLSKVSMDELNILIAEEPEGINARELIRNTYIILPK